MSEYILGFDYGTISCRLVCADSADGRIVFRKVCEYPDGVIEDRLPSSGAPLGEGWALENPDDYLYVQKKLVGDLLRETDIDPKDIAAIGIDFTNCTMLPVDEQGKALCQTEKYRDDPHAWVKLWKHHAAEKQARRICEIAQKRGEKWLRRYGDTVSAEWMFPKILQIYEEDRSVYDDALAFTEAVDWVVLQMTGRWVRSSAMLGVNCFWSAEDGYPSREFFAETASGFDSVLDKLRGDILPVGTAVGMLTEEYAAGLGLHSGVVVAIGHGDSEVAACGLGVTGPHEMIMVMGTSQCYQYMAKEYAPFPGLCSIVEDGMVPGYYAYEAGQCAVGDIYAWFMENALPGAYYEEAAAAEKSIYALMNEKAAAIPAGSSGLIALDWWNGCRSLLMNYDLTGLVMGMTMRTKPEEIYRALVESTAFGARAIIEAFIENGLPVNEIIATGGLALKAPFVVQLFSDILNIPIRVPQDVDAGMMGAAVCGAAALENARNGTLDFQAVTERMIRRHDIVYSPGARDRAVYDDLYAIYRDLSAAMGGTSGSAMERLLKIRRENNQ